VENLKLVSQIQDPHLIKLLASFEYNGNRHLLFPWADGGSLRDLWQKHADPDRLGENLAEWVIQQCQGIASALAHIHDPWLTDDKPGDYLSQKPKLFGRHGDLKPENILSFKGDSETHELGVLKIADFGLAKWSATSQAKPMGSKIRLSPTYRAPEVDVENGVISRRYDIWALGCLYLEFVTWYLMGWDAVEHMFSIVRVAGDPDWKSVKEDTFFRIETNGQDGSKGERTAIVKPEVTKVQRL
jgi:serine/threonine protein kinase